MHILTKIFVVLVSLLAILLVPLVVVSTQNQEHWRSDALSLKADVARLRSEQVSDRQLAQTHQANLQSQLAEYSAREQALMRSLQESTTGAEDLQSRLDDATNKIAMTQSRVSALSQSMKTSTALSEKLVGDLDFLRERALTAERQRAELTERLAELDSQIQVSESVQRALREENESLKAEHKKVSAELSKYVAQFGDIGTAGTMSLEDGIAPDRNLEATVVDVARGDAQTLIEIDAGSRDGVQKGWLMSVGDGGTFIGRLRIIEVDLNRSTGLLMLENRDRGKAAPGQRAYALAGQH
ncbi:MAG: hypothetical protein MK077_05260 [Phycisphaerales bacterium]|nr:hypothetical protein [Phycisphaerales bacterium]